MDVDYGTSHMGMPIHFDYAGGTLRAMETIGQRIKARRLELGFTRQKDLAELAGIDQSTLSDIERGANTKPAVLLALCEALRTTPEFLVKGQLLETAQPRNPPGWPLRLAYADFVKLPSGFHTGIEELAKPYVTLALTPSSSASDLPQNVTKREQGAVVFRRNKRTEVNDGSGNTDQGRRAAPATRKSAGHRK